MRLPKSGFDSNRGNLRLDVGERAGDGPLFGSRRFRNHRDRTIARDAIRGEVLRDRGQIAEAHQKHDRAVELRQRFPLDAGRCIRFVAGDECERGGVGAMRDRNPGVCGSGQRGRNARHDLERDAGRGQLLRFFATASEDERIAAFEPDDRFPFLRFVDQELVDLLLRQRVFRCTLADVDNFRALRRAIRDGVGDESIDGDEIGACDEVRGADRQETGIAGTGTDEKDLAGHFAAPDTSPEATRTVAGGRARSARPPDSRASIDIRPRQRSRREVTAPGI
jgi:hypothetical protein